MTRHVLIVEDDADIREAIGELLTSEGHEVTLATDGAAALATLGAMRVLPDVILLDLMMPVMDGFQFRRVQRGDARLSSIPVVVMSADPQLDTRSADLAARSCIRKPFDLDALLSAVATA